MSKIIQVDTANKSNLAYNPYVIYCSSLSQGSYNTVVNSLSAVCNFLAPGISPKDFPWHQLRYAHIMHIRKILNNKYSAATTNKIMFFIKGVLKECKRLGLINAEDYQHSVDFKPLKSVRELRGRLIEKWEIQKLFNLNLSLHDKALFKILRLGLRRNEVSQLNWNDIDFNNQSLLIKGKGNKERTMFMPDKTVLDLQAWQSNSKASCIFVGNTNKRIQNKRIGDIVTKSAWLAGLQPITPHDFRRTFASEMLDAGIDLVTVQQMMGHSSPSTTASYDRRGDSTKRKAVELLSS